MKKARNKLLAGIVLLSVSLLSSVAVFAQARKSDFASFDFPLSGVVDTEATGINSSGVIVGRYYTADGKQHGFVLKNGKFRSLDIAGTDTHTDAAWINQRGYISGNYDTGGRTHAYVLSPRGKITTIDFPGALVTTG